MAKSPRKKSPGSKKSPARKKSAGTKSPRVDEQLAASAMPSPKELLDQFRHEMHLLEAQLKRLEGDTPKLPESTRRKVRALRDRVIHLEEEAKKHPELVQVLGLEESLPTEPVKIAAVVPETKFETFEVQVEESQRIASAPLPVDWPRSGQTIVGDNKLGDLETVGRVRVQLNLDDGKPLARAEFRIVAKSVESGDWVLLRSASTNSVGYASVKLNNVVFADIGDLSIEVGAEISGEEEESEGHRFNIHDAQIATHRDLGLPHKLRIASPIDGLVGAPTESEESDGPEETAETPEHRTNE